MPKLVNRNPKLGKNGIHAVVRYKGKTHRLGKHGTPEALKAYNRFCAELTSNPETFLMPKEPEAKITLDEVAAAYIDYAESRFFDTQYTHYEHYRVGHPTKFGTQPERKQAVPKAGKKHRRCLGIVPLKRQTFTIIRTCGFVRNLPENR